MNRPLTREEKIELLLALEERHRRRERRRLETEREDILRRCSGLYGFIEEFWYVLEPARKFTGGWAIRAMCAHLEAVTSGKIPRLLMTVPPGMMKSLLLVFWPAWEWGPQRRPYLQYLATSFSQPNVFRDNMKMRRLVESEKFQALWPIKFRSDQNAKGKFENTDNGFREGRPFVAMTGGRGDRVLVDDPHSVDGAESDAERASAVQTFREGITDRLNDITTSAIVIIMQRLHEQDVAGTALELDIGFVHLMLPMEFEADRRCSTLIGFTDPRTYDGELLFPERFPAESVAKLKKAKGAYAWAGQYQQRPAPRSGGLFKREWFEIVQAAPNRRSRCRAWDLAASLPKAGRSADWSAGLLLSRDSDGVFYVEHVDRFQRGPSDVERSVKQRAQTDGLDTIVRMTQDPGQAGKAQAEAFTRLLAGYPLVLKTATGEKSLRATPAAAQAEAGNVKILATGDPDRDAWIADFLDEVSVFPAGRHDDQVDAFADALNELALGDDSDSLAGIDFSAGMFHRANPWAIGGGG